jgi:hypothetical protein
MGFSPPQPPPSGIQHFPFFHPASGCFSVNKSDKKSSAASDVVPLGAGLAALACLHAEHLLALAVVLLDFPADAAHTLYGDGGVLGQVVGDDKFPSGWPPRPGTV